MQLLPILSIPEQFQAGLAKLRELNEDTASSLLAAIESLAQESGKDSLSSQQLPPIKHLSQEDAQTILDGLTFLYRVRASSDATVAEFVSDASEAMRYGAVPRYKVPEGAITNFRDRINKFLSLESLNTLSKAIILRSEHEHTLCSARILTDIRPVFGPDPNAAPQTAVIFHMLKLAFHEASSIKEIYLALDESDLAELENLVERAKKKALSLHTILASRNMRVVDPE